MSVRARIPAIARTLLGLAFVVFGFNYFVNFLPTPPPSADAMAFFGALAAGKIFAIIKPIELAAGLALLGNRFVPLALALLAPIQIGILAFHVSIDPSGLPVIVILIALTIYLAWSYRSAFAPMLRARVEPTAGDAVAAPRRRPAAA